MQAGNIPTVYRPAGSGRITVRMPYALGNRAWIHHNLGSGIHPVWNTTDKRWELARNHLRATVEALVERFGIVDVVIDSYAVTRCRDAVGDDCDCQCVGENHGGAAYWKHWHAVGETTLIGTAGIVRRRMRVGAGR